MMTTEKYYWGNYDEVAPQKVNITVKNNIVNCEYCDNPIPINKSCPHCGAPQKAREEIMLSTENKMATLTLWEHNTIEAIRKGTVRFSSLMEEVGFEKAKDLFSISGFPIPSDNLRIKARVLGLNIK